MATFVRRVPLLLSICAILTVNQCQAQVLDPGLKKDNNILQGNQNNLQQGLNAFPNAGGNIQPAVNNLGQQMQQRQFLQQPVQQAGAVNLGNIQPEAFNLRTFMLAEHPSCAEDVQRICSKTMKRNNFAVLDCLQDSAAEPEEMGQVSEQCQHLVWTYKRNLTKDDRFESAQKEVCARELHEFQECQALEMGQGKRIPCLIEHMENITGPCRHFLNRMAKIVFSDYHYVWHFMENCNQDVERFKCGRSETDEGQLHQQGKTMKCLAQNLRQLALACKKQILRVAELQADDYHHDRPLYYACRDDRENLCANVEAGGGRVFECLFQHKQDKAMSDKCREMLRLRQQLMAEDVKVDETFYTACRQDIVRQQCLTGPVDDQDWARSAILLCLENAVKRGRKVSGECISEMNELREELMEDYEITPEIVTGCANEVKQYCAEVGTGGKTIHCLMKHVNPRSRKVDQRFSDECRAAIEMLLQEADVEEDIKIDHVLAQACAPVIESACQPGQVQEGVIDCLLDKLDDERMTEDCEDRLLEIQYFIVRDFRLDEELYKNCHKDAVDLCHAAVDWHETKPGADYSPMIFPCLYRHWKNQEGPSLSKSCRRELKRTMRQRAQRIDLDPMIEEACMYDLGQHCSDLEHYGKNMEIECLQENYEELREECREAIGNFTEDEDEDIELDRVLMKACTPMIKKFCQDVLENDNPDAEDVMDCLIEHKNHREMNEKCRAGIEHHQIIQLEDYRFSHKFKEACKKAVTTYCTGRKKNEVVVCLSEMVREDTLTDHQHRVDEACRKQLRVEVLRRGEDIDLDPELRKACADDLRNYCSGKHAGNAELIECLRDHQPKLSKPCHKVLFKREKVEAVESLGDFRLFKECKSMIKKHCSMEINNGQADVLDCLKRVKNEEGFDSNCRIYVLKRQLEESRDIRINPSLYKQCRLDIPKFCNDIEIKDDEETEGRVIHCLKRHFLQKKLSSGCAEEIRSLIKETVMNIDLDPVLKSSCRTEIQQFCSEQMKASIDKPNARGAGPDAIEECLKYNLFLKKINPKSPCGQEVIRMADESRVDVHIDPQLYQACLIDITAGPCGGVPSGQGQKMSCLLTVLEDNPKGLKPKCKELLEQRKALWEYSANPAPPESLQELGASVMQSRSKTYLMGVLMTIVGVIFLVGISCGRVTKRVPLSMKNK